jgi:hypothetical protein
LTFPPGTPCICICICTRNVPLVKLGVRNYFLYIPDNKQHLVNSVIVDSTFRRSCLEFTVTAQQSEEQLQDSHIASLIGACKIHCISSAAVGNIHAQYSVTYISFAHDYAKQFHTEDFHCRYLYKEKIVRKRYLKYGFPVFHLFRNQAYLTAKESHFQHLI